MKILNERGKTVLPKEHQLIVKQAKQCIRILCRKEHEVIKPNSLLIKTVLKRSYGGCVSYRGDKAAHIKIGVNILRGKSWMNDGDKSTLFQEYRSIKTDPTIGNLICHNYEHMSYLMVAHEIAHAVHFSCGPHIRWVKEYKPHGLTWQRLYRILRREINNWKPTAKK